MNVERTMQRIRQRTEALRKLQGKKISCGFFEESQYENDIKVAKVAFYNEFGTTTAPPRPFFRPCVKNNKRKWVASLRRGVVAVENNRINAENMLNQIGLMMQGDLMESIVNVNEPPLSPITLMLRKWKNEGILENVRKRNVWEALRAVQRGEDYSSAPTKPLQDTGKMLMSVQYKIS